MKNSIENLLNEYSAEKIKSMNDKDISDFIFDCNVKYKESDLFLYYLYLIDNMNTNLSDNDANILTILRHDCLKNLRKLALYSCKEEHNGKYFFLHKDFNVDNISNISKSDEYIEFINNHLDKN